MVNYTCYRCNYMTDHRGKIKYHLNRKIPCSTIKLNVEILNISNSFSFFKNKNLELLKKSLFMTINLLFL